MKLDVIFENYSLLNRTKEKMLGSSRQNLEFLAKLGAQKNEASTAIFCPKKGSFCDPHNKSRDVP